MQPALPPGTIRSLLASDLVTPPTRAALQRRLDGVNLEDPPRFFDADTLAVLRAVCARLLPIASTPGGPPAAEIAALVDARLAEGGGNGWRYDALPPDGEAYRQNLSGLDAKARERFGVGFAALADTQQDALLRAAQPAASRWFEELLAELVELFYGHPGVQETIGYVGMADARGWHKIGLNEREDWEAGVRNAECGLESATGRGARATMRNEEADSADVSPPSALRTPHSALPPMRRHAETEVVDAVVIGTGVGGGPLLMRLAQAGLKVVALEAGKWWDPARDFATDEREQNKLYWLDERLSAGGDPLAFGNNNSGIGVGGSTLHFTAYTPRPQPDDFLLRRDFGVGCDWPFGYEELEPYFDELEHFLGVSGPSPYPWGPPRRRGYALAPLPLNAAAQLMQRACAGLGYKTSPAPNAALSAPFFQPGVGQRPACTNRGFCQAGCSTGAKASVDVTFIPPALAAGAEVRAEAFVTRLERDAQGRVCAVIYTKEGKERRQRCRHVFLCAGAVETPRLLLMNGLANASGQLGRNLMAHTGLQIWGRFEEETQPWKGIPGGLISEDTHRPADADFAGGYLLQSIGVMPVTYASQLARGRQLWAEELGEHMRGYNHVAGINILGDCLPSARNHLALSNEKDARGLPKPRVHFTAEENELRLTAHAERTMRAIWEAAGGRDLWSFQRFAHVIGTCRMGADPSENVVNADGRCFDVPGLFICDNSVFPSALSVNPALTILALSLRTADRFLESQKIGG